MSFFIPGISSDSIIIVCLVVLLTAVTYYVQSKAQKKAIHQRISAWLPAVSRGRRTSTAKTPPRSLTPEKKVPDNGPPSSEYRDIYPPSTRGNLPIWSQSWSSLASALRNSTSNDDTAREVVNANNIIGFEQDYRDCQSSTSTYTPMGISIAEVKALGDFPDYSKLNGVPLPQPYKEHRLEMAIERPYRPFRWAYHQTMCTFHLMHETMSH